MTALARRRPDWDRLYRIAAGQLGHFSTRQAARAGYSPQLLAKYLRNGRVMRVRRAVYRLKHFPPGEREELVAAWLWSDRAGVISHQTALALHGLAPARSGPIHLTLPSSWRRRRVRVPPGVVLHHADLAAGERTRMGAVATTTAERAWRDCAAASGQAPTSASTEPRTMKFLCLISARRMLDAMPAAEAERHLAGYRAVTDELRRRGQLLDCNRLLPAETATTVRVRRGRVTLSDGPFAETKELIGGYFVISARDRAEAIAVAARFPGAGIGSVEVRPIADDPGTLAALGLAAAAGGSPPAVDRPGHRSSRSPRRRNR